MKGNFLLKAKITNPAFHTLITQENGIEYFTTGYETRRYLKGGQIPDEISQFSCHWKLPVSVQNDIVMIYDGLQLFDHNHNSINPRSLDVNIMLSEVIDHNRHYFDQGIEGRKNLYESYLYRFWDNRACDRLKTLPPKLSPEHEDFMRVGRNLEQEYIPTEKIAGSLHSRYANMSWQDVFFELKRDGTLWKSLISNETEGLFRERMNDLRNISFIKINGVYYVNSGSHRTTAAVMMNLERIGPVPVTEYNEDVYYKGMFHKLKNLGFDVRTYSDDERKRQKMSRALVEYPWEIFSIHYNGNTLDLNGKEEIREFIEVAEEYIQYKKMNFLQKILYNKKFRDRFPEAVVKTLD